MVESQQDKIISTLYTRSGQIIGLSSKKVLIRKAQPIFISSRSTFHSFHGDFVENNSNVVTLIYQKLSTGDIVQGIPKVEQFFESRTTKRGRLFRENLPNLLKGLFLKYFFYCWQFLKQVGGYSKLYGKIEQQSINDQKVGLRSDKEISRENYVDGYPQISQTDSTFLAIQWAVQQSFYKIQQIAVDGVLRVYRSQGVSISDKHLEIVVKQMTTKVRIIRGGQTGLFPGELVDLDFVQSLNAVLVKKILYEPVILGITQASLQVDSFLSSASFQQTSRILSQSALVNKKDFLKGVKENVIVGNLIPTGTGYLVSLE
jgi:DNA-directed RNA polymerase subunit beta'